MYAIISRPIVGQLAQLAQPGIDTPEEAALIFSGPQFFIALLSGLVLAFGFQLLLTNLSLAAGISYVGHSSSSSSSSNSQSSGGPSVKRISLAVGFWTLITVSLALFCACWLAVKLSLYNSALLGAITGLVIWGTYFSLLFWFSSTTVGSLMGSVVRTATASFNSLVGTATSAFGAKAASNQIFETAEAVAAAVRKEISHTLDEGDLVDSIQDYVSTLRSPELDVDNLELAFKGLIQDSGLSNVADAESLSQLDRGTFEELVRSRTDLSRQESDRVAGRLYRIWQREVSQASGRQPLAELVDYVQSARPGDRIAIEMGNRLDQFLDEYRRRGQSQSTLGPLSQGFNTLMGAVMGSANLSDMDVETITQKVKQVKSELVSQSQGLADQFSDTSEPYSVVKADVENYLLSTYPWQLQTERLEAQFRDVIYDVDASAELLRAELQQLQRSDFEAVLGDRGLLTPADIERTSAVLEGVRQQVLKEIIDVDRYVKAKNLQSKLQVFLRQTPKAELMSEMGDQAFSALIAGADANFDDLQVRYSEINTDFLSQHLRMRPDFSDAEADLLVARFEQLKNQQLSEAHTLQERAKLQVQDQWHNVQEHLRNTGRSELNPDGIKRELRLLLNEPDVGLHRLRQRFEQFDRESLIQVLNQRDDLSEQDIRRIVRDVESNWYQIVNAPARLTAQAQAKYDEATSAIANYLRQTRKPELNPEGIQRDLQTLIDHPSAGAEAVKARLSAMDRDTLVKLLSQRDDLSEQEADQIIDDLISTIRQVLKAPQRLAKRAKDEVISFEQALEDYLRNTDKAALSPDGIKHDLQLLLDDPRLGSQRIGQRLAAIDRDTVIALLAQRPDMTREDAAAAVDQVLAVRDELLLKLQMVQDKIQSVINRLLARVRAYLNSLERSELNYEGIRRDLRTVFDDPQAGFDALKQRLAHCDRNTLVAIVSSHDAISETDANRVIDQMESARDSALQKAERLEREVENRVQALKQEAQHQVDEARKAAEAAAWWIFSTATISAIVSAIAGSLAVAS